MGAPRFPIRADPLHVLGEIEEEGELAAAFRERCDDIEAFPGNIHEGVRYSASHGRAVTFSCSSSGRRQRQTT